MTPREVSPAHFPNLAATLFAERTVIALIPATSDFPWAADAAWAAARAVAQTGRRVGLVDLCFQQPVLQRRTTGTPDEGIVDAFVFGVSLGHVAREPEPGLHFIGAGTTPSNPDEVFTNDRWQRLARGFRQEGALLLLFIPPSALTRLNVELDGVVVLSPTGYDPGSPTFPAIRERVAAGTPLLAVVRTQRASGRVTPPAQTRPSLLFAPRPGPGARGALVAAVSAAVVLAAAGAWLVWGSRVSGGGGGGTAPARSAPDANPPVAPAVVSPSPAASRGDTLFYSVQVAAFNRADQAMVYARDFQEVVGAATVTPVSLGQQGLWYRVLVGSLPTAATADSLLRALWAESLVDRPNGTILRTPQAYALGAFPDRAAASKAADGLRRRGVAAYIVPAPNGSAQVLCGAFEAPEQALAADSLLRLAGLKGTLVQRMGTRP
jgi:cell division septation protein DedD